MLRHGKKDGVNSQIVETNKKNVTHVWHDAAASVWIRVTSFLWASQVTNGSNYFAFDILSLAYQKIIKANYMYFKS